jgi:hypothetical protein
MITAAKNSQETTAFQLEKRRIADSWEAQFPALRKFLHVMGLFPASLSAKCLDMLDDCPSRVW